MPRLVVDLSKETHMALKLRALREGTSISALVRDMIEDGQADVVKVVKPRSAVKSGVDLSKTAQAKGRTRA